MKKTELISVLILCLSLNISLYSQTKDSNQQNSDKSESSKQLWVDMMKDLSVNFYDVQKEFNDYYKDKRKGKGSGWKQFKRWEHFMEQRVYPSGNRLNHAQVWNEINEFNKKHPEHSKKLTNEWTSMGPTTCADNTGHWSPGIGRINVIARDPHNTDKIFIGAPSGGVWKTIDNGQNWEVLTDHLPVLGVSAIAIDPSNTNIIYIGTGDKDAGDNYSIGILKSADGGQTWNETGMDWNIYQNRTISKLLIDPTNSNILFAATTNGLFKSTNAGDSWEQVQSGNFDDIEFKPGDPSVIYGITPTFYKSTNGGETFSSASELPTNSRAQIAVTEANPNYVYFFSSSDGVFRSEDSGDTFTYKSQQPTRASQAFYNLAMAVSHTNADEVHIGAINTWKSTDGGVAWTQTTDWKLDNYYGYTHCDIHEMVFYGDTLFVGSDGLISYSTDGADNFINITEGISIRQFYRIGVSKTNANKIIGGSQDNGTSVYTEDHWHEWLGADGMECAVDYTNDSVVYGTIQRGYFRKSNTGGNFGEVSITQPGTGSWVTPFVMHPTNPEILYVGIDVVRKTSDGMNSWSSISDNLGADDLYDFMNNMAISESDPNYLYVTRKSSIWRTDNEGENWLDISSGLPDLFISYIAVHPLKPQKIAISLSGYDEGNKVYISEDGGDTWINVSENLPNIPANCVIFNNDNTDGLYVGMDVGIYYQDNLNPYWETFSTGLPNVIVNELDINYPTGKIRAATYGRGLWEAEIRQANDDDILTAYTVNANTDEIIENGESVKLDISLTNQTDKVVSNISMTVSSDNEYIKITDDTEVFGNINSGESTNINNAFAFEVAKNTPNNYYFDILTHITSDHNSWERIIKLKAIAPTIEHTLITINNNDNGILNIGEVNTITLKVKNLGGAKSNNVKLVISSNDEYVTLTNTSTTISEFSSAMEQDFNFNIEIYDNAPIMGHNIEFTLDIIADNYSNSKIFTLPIGTLFEDFERQTLDNLSWVLNGPAKWHLVNDEVYEGKYALKSGNVLSYEETMLSLELDILAKGEISFFKKVSCEDKDDLGNSTDYLTFIIDDNEVGRWEGDDNWSKVTYVVDNGNHSFNWKYTKNNDISEGEDCAWIDFIVFPPTSQVPLMNTDSESIIKQMKINTTSVDTLILFNDGSGILNYSIIIDEATSDPTWISLNNTSGIIVPESSENIKISFDSEGLEVDTYNCELVISNQLGTEKRVPISLTVTLTGIDECLNSGIMPIFVYPNPFNEQITFNFKTVKPYTLDFEIFDITGKKIRTVIQNETLPIGNHSLQWDGTDDAGETVPSGSYFYHLKTDNKPYSGKVLFLK